MISIAAQEKLLPVAELPALAAPILAPWPTEGTAEGVAEGVAEAGVASKARGAGEAGEASFTTLLRGEFRYTVRGPPHQL